MITHFIDIFMKQGMKSMIKLIISLLKKLESKIIKCKTLEELEMIFFENSLKFNSFDESEIFQDLINTTITKNKLKNFELKNIEKIESYLTKIKRLDFKYTRPKIEDFSDIFENEKQLEILWSWLPIKQKMQTIYKIFSTKEDGYNLTTIYKKINNLESPLILLISATSIEGDHQQIEKEILKENQKKKKKNLNEIKVRKKI